MRALYQLSYQGNSSGRVRIYNCNTKRGKGKPRKLCAMAQKPVTQYVGADQLQTIYLGLPLLYTKQKGL